VGWQSWLRTAGSKLLGASRCHRRPNGHALSHPGDLPGGSGAGVASAITSAVGIQPSGTENHTFKLLGPDELSGRRQPQPVAAWICGRLRRFRGDHPGRCPGHRRGGRRVPRGAGRMLAIMHALDGALAGRADGIDSLSVAPAVVVGAVVRRDTRRPVRRGRVAQYGAPGGATVFGWRGMRITSRPTSRRHGTSDRTCRG